MDGTEAGQPAGRTESDLRALVEGLGAHLVSAGGRNLTTMFEQALQRCLSARVVRLREVPARGPARLVAPTRTMDSVVLPVATTDPRVQAVLEASAADGRILDAADLALLRAAAALGGLVLEASRHAALASPRAPADLRALVGASVVMSALRDRIDRVAATDFTVLVEGESGTGKELVARQIHECSRRRNGPFVAVNCAAVVDTLLEAELFGIEERTATGVRGRRGKFENADGGTIFLDEVADLSASAQAKLLRAVQDLAVERVGATGAKRVNTRIVVATNKPLGGLVERGVFRADLYYRFSGVEIHVPPLRERPDDITELARHFLSRHAHGRERRFSPAAEEALRLYSWPGNVRELERFVERAVALTEHEQIDVHDLPAAMRGGYAEVFGPPAAVNASMRVWGSRYATLVFERCGRNKRRACEQLDISYHTLQAYLRFAERQATGRGQLPRWARSTSDPSAPTVSDGPADDEPPGARAVP
jgi:transcriptional regulator with PAS, ATPase and Fis domain